MSNLWFEIKWHFRWNWGMYVIVALVILAGIVFWHIPYETERSPAVVTTLAEGTVVNIRATGAWENWCKIELKFEDGVVLLTSYYFIQQWNIREGREYLIQRSSRVGMIAKELI